MCCTRLATNTGRKNDAKNRHLGTIPQLCRTIPSRWRHVSTIGKKLLNSNIFPGMCPYNMVNFVPLAAKIVSLVWGTPGNFNGFRVLTATARHSSSGSQPKFAALNGGRHLHSAGRPSRWALAHILVNTRISCLDHPALRAASRQTCCRQDVDAQYVSRLREINLRPS